MCVGGRALAGEAGGGGGGARAARVPSQSRPRRSKPRTTTQTVMKPISLDFSRKHWRQTLRPYLRIRPPWLEQTRLFAQLMAGCVCVSAEACSVAQHEEKPTAATQLRYASMLPLLPNSCSSVRVLASVQPPMAMGREPQLRQAPAAVAPRARLLRIARCNTHNHCHSRRALQEPPPSASSPLAAALAILLRVAVPDGLEAHLVVQGGLKVAL